MIAKVSGSLRNIILVDDEQSVLTALRLLMQAVGYSVKAFTSGDAALEYLRKDAESQLFICDLRMPRKNGLAVLQEAKQLRPDLPFVLMSAHADSQEQQMATELGSQGFLAKPFMPDQLHKLVAEIEEKQKS